MIDTNNCLPPLTYYLRIGKIPTNNEETNDPNFDREVFCSVNDIEMLVIGQNEVCLDLFSGTWLEKELDEIRDQAVKETWGTEE